MVQKAAKLQLAGEYSAATKLYKSLLALDGCPPQVFANYGALLRSSGHREKALELYQKGLERYPLHPSILANRANIVKESQPITAFFDLVESIKSDPTNLNAVVTACSILKDNDLLSTQYAFVLDVVPRLSPHPKVLLVLLSALCDLEFLVSPLNSKLLPQILQLTDASLKVVDAKQQIELLLSLAFCYAQAGLTQLGMQHYARALDVLGNSEGLDAKAHAELNDVFTQSSWNIGCSLLKNGNFTDGWRLYDYGLRTPADGQQKWQRALRKPFPECTLPLWRGESLSDKRLLLLEEQGIGDTMMFLTLLPTIIDEALQVDVVVSSRLRPLYVRAFKDYGAKVTVYEQSDLFLQAIHSKSYDFQSPLGSICRYRFTDIGSYSPRCPLLRPSSEGPQRLREHYLQTYPSTQKLIGVSWSGGGTPGRIRKKSPPIDVFNRLLLDGIEGVTFVSLQYGNVVSVVERWQRQGARLIHDADIDPLTDMDSWLDQVAACDAVISAANTTIHGAGGLNLPTLCLLSLHADWRWLRDSSVTRSYWYPSVGILRESLSDGWRSVLHESKQWLLAGCPLPEGANLKSFAKD